MPDPTPERPSAEPGCAEPGCPAEPIDLYCFEHEVYLPRRDAEQSRSAWGVVGAVAAGALLWTAAAYDAAFPLYVVFTGALWAVLRLTLRRLPLARDVAQVTWAAAAIALPVYVGAPDRLRRAAVAGALLVALGAWVVHTAVEAADRAGERDRRVVTASVTALGAAAAICSAYAIASYLPAKSTRAPACPTACFAWCWSVPWQRSGSPRPPRRSARGAAPARRMPRCSPSPCCRGRWSFRSPRPPRTPGAASSGR